MSEERLYQALDFILNQATVPEMEVLITALKRRLGEEHKGPLGLNPQKLGMAMAEQVGSQVRQSLDQVRDTVKNFVAEMIKKDVPDIPEEHLRELLQAWVPDENAKRTQSGPLLPADLLITMIRQFVSFSLGVMPLREQETLRDSIPDWHARYWERFPGRVRNLISQYIKGGIDEELFLNRIEWELYPSGPPAGDDEERLDGHGSR